MAQGSGKIANRLVVLSSAAVLAVYTAGYTRTRSAANRFEAQAAERRPAAVEPVRTPVRGEAPVAEVPKAEVAPVTPAHPKREAPKAAEVASVAPVHVPEVAAASAPVTPAAPVEAAPPVVEPKAEAVAAPAAPAAKEPQVWKDGTYFGWGTSRHGDIQASVVIEGGKIQSASIFQCLTRYSCDVIEKLPPEVAARQSPDVDYVSGATQSANAFYWAVVEALKQAK